MYEGGNKKSTVNNLSLNEEIKLFNNKYESILISQDEHILLRPIFV